MSNSNGQSNEQNGFLKYFRSYGWAMSMAIYFVIMAVFIATYPYLNVIAGFLLLALSTFAMGGLLGFMFGVPGADPNSPARTDSRQRTNLELISDWLTKILLGAGLVELKSITEAAVGFSKSMGESLPSSMLLGEYIGLFIALGFGACGVVTGYLWSQLHFDHLKNAERNT